MPIRRPRCSNIYAIGDVTNRINLTPVAIREGHAFADTVFGGKPTRVDHSDVPTAVFSEPEVGVIGLTEAQACEQFARVDVYKSSFRPMKATLAGRDTRAFFKLVVDAASGRVVGCHIVGPDAGEMIQLVGIAVKMNATKADFDRVMAVHPTAAGGTRDHAREGLHAGAPGGGVGCRDYSGSWHLHSYIYRPNPMPAPRVSRIGAA